MALLPVAGRRRSARPPSPASPAPRASVFLHRPTREARREGRSAVRPDGVMTRPAMSGCVGACRVRSFCPRGFRPAGRKAMSANGCVERPFGPPLGRLECKGRSRTWKLWKVFGLRGVERSPSELSDSGGDLRLCDRGLALFLEEVSGVRGLGQSPGPGHLVQGDPKAFLVLDPQGL